MLCLGLAQLAMGSGALLGRRALEGAGPLCVAAARLGMVSLPFVLRHLLRRRPWLPLATEARLAAAGLLLAGQFVLWTLALTRLSVGATTLLTCCTPLWNGLFDVLVRRRRLPRPFWLALAAAIGGVALILAPGGRPDASNTPAGLTLATACGIVSAGYMQLVRHVSRADQPGERLDMFDVVTRTYAVAALGLAALLPLEAAPLPPLRDVGVWGSIVGMAAITQGLGHTLQNISLQHLPARLVSAATLVEPLIATVAAAYLFGEALGAQTAVGGLVVLLALGVTLRTSR